MKKQKAKSKSKYVPDKKKETISTTPMLKTEALRFEYSGRQDESGVTEKFTAINGIDIQIKKGEFVAILGHNGSGKSTLGKLINALLLPSSGRVWVNGLDTSLPENLWNVRQSAGMVFQNPDNQIIATIIEEDVAFGAENLGIPPEEIRRRVDSSLAAVGMSEYALNSPHFLSGGQKQRIAIAGTLAMKPDCIILDEPTSMLDPSGRKEVIETITRLNRDEGITIILITHFMDEATRADRVIVTEEGSIVMDDTPKNIFKNIEKLRELRLDVPQVTELCHILRARGFNLPDDIISIDEMVGAICSIAQNTRKTKVNPII